MYQPIYAEGFSATFAIITIIKVAINERILGWKAVHDKLHRKVAETFFVVVKTEIPVYLFHILSRELSFYNLYSLN